MTAKKLSNITEQLVPLEVRSNAPGFTTFIRSYFEFLEREFGEYDAIVQLLNYRDIDETVDEFVKHFLKAYANPISEASTSNLKTLIKQIRNFYQAKGTEEAYTYLFKAIFNTSLEFYFPKDDVLKTNTIDRRLSETSAHLTDSNYWQDFSYVLRTGVSGEVYENLLYALGHPAGLKIFGEFRDVNDDNLDLDISFVESLLFVVFIDDLIGINGLNFTLPTQPPMSVIISENINGTFPSFGRLAADVEDFNVILYGRENDLIETFSGQTGEQKSLVFYERLKQDIDGFRTDNNKITLLEPGLDTGTYFDNRFNQTTSTVTDISFTSTSTIDIDGSVNPGSETDLSVFSAGDIINIQTTSGVNDGQYTISLNPTASQITVTGTPFTIQTAAVVTDGIINNLTSYDIYTTTLRDQPVLADKLLSVIKLPNAKYAETLNAESINNVTLPSSAVSSDEILMFYNGRKIPNSGIGLASADVNGFRNATMSGFENVPTFDPVEVYYQSHDAEQFVGFEGADQTISLVQTPVNVMVFINGYFVKPSEYTITGNDIVISSAVLTSLGADGNPIEIIHIPNITKDNQEYFTTLAGQTEFFTNRTIEKKRFADSSNSIKIIDATEYFLDEVPAQPLQDVLTAQSPINYWKLDEGEEALPATDTQGNLNLTWDGGLDFGTLTTTSTRGDGVGAAVNFAGTSGFNTLTASAGVPTNASATFQTGDFAVAMGVTLGTIGASDRVLIGGGNEGLLYGFWVDETTNALDFRFQRQAQTSTVIPNVFTAGMSASTPVWLVLEGDVANDEIRAYVNDTLVGTADMSLNPDWDNTGFWREANAGYIQDFGLGSISLNDKANWAGVMDEVVYFNRLLTTQEKTDQYNAWVQT